MRRLPCASSGAPPTPPPSSWFPGRVSGAPLQPGGHGLRLAHHAQHVRAGEAREVAIGPAPANELGKQVRVAGDVAQTIGLEVGAVEVAAQPDVVDSGRARDVLDVVRYHRNGW